MAANPQPPPAVLRAAERALGTTIDRVDEIRGGGFTPSIRRRIATTDGRTFFLKVAVDDLTGTWLRTEQNIYRHVSGGFLPRVAAWGEDDARPWLVLEDLGDEGWPPPWSPSDIAAVRDALDELHAVPVPSGVEPLPDTSPLLAGWRTVAADPAPLLSTGVCTPGWLERHLPALEAACRPEHARGDALLHMDVRSDNVCITARGALLVDWNWAVAGDPRLDIAFWLPSLTMETGLPPDDPGLGPYLPAMVAGFFASFAGLPEIPDAPGVRDLQRAQLAVALPWAARALDLPEPVAPAAVPGIG